MIELIDIIFNEYLRIFIAIVFVGLILFSLYCSYYNKLKKFLNWKCSRTDCKVDLSKLHLKKCLHTHHKDGDASNISRNNCRL